MIVRHLSEIEGTDRDVKTPHWVSRRLLLKKDGMGFSLHETTVYAGAELEMCYKNHFEAVYCIEGEGEVKTLPDGAFRPIQPGVVYALNEHDHHLLRAKTDMKLVCVFNPPLTGQEVHDETGAYPAESDYLKGAKAS